MNRMSLLYKMDGLLEDCKTCTRPYATPDVKCKGCETYTQLREIGNQLGRGKDMKKLTKELYNDLKSQGLSDKQISQKVGVSTATIWNYKNKWNEKPKQADTDVLKPSEGKSPSMDKTAEFRALINELSNELNDVKKSSQDKDKLIGKLEAKVQELESTVPFNKLESEVKSLKEERDNYRNQLLDTRDQLVRKDYILENNKKDIENFNKVLRTLTKEKQVLKDLVKANAMVQLEFL